ncbi:hypothetical protein [Azospirillum sp. TSO35-2]|uniref:hypothetical protein n=1 Tax=Azospirillum sp. TSO35-2 TaxID=716796 RepID=UPI000D64CAAF|nr:hypothetical protein [Azospirillum sp. TSO35-2]
MPSKGPSAGAFKRRGGRFAGTSDAEFGKFLSPEQQHLLRKRREAEQREAKRRRSLAGVVLTVAAAAAGGVWALLWL